MSNSNTIPTVVTQNELCEILKLFSQREMVEITTSTDLDMRKTNNPYYGKVKKVQTIRAVINQNYAELVNNALILEGKAPDFQSKPRKWGEKLANCPLIKHKEAYYLEATVMGGDPINTPVYKMFGVDVKKEILLPFLPQKNESNRINQGLEKEVIIRDIKLSNIIALKINDKFYIINQ